MPYRMRDPEQVADEIRRDGQPYCVFTDNNLGSNREYLLRLCRSLEPLDIVWSAAVSIDVTDDPRVVRAMAVSGCTVQAVQLAVALVDQRATYARSLVTTGQLDSIASPDI